MNKKINIVMLTIIGSLIFSMSLQADAISKAEFLLTKLNCGTDSLACNNTGCNYRDGLGTEVNDEKALEYFKKSCKEGKGEMDGCYNVGDMLSGGYSIKEDWREAVKYYTMSADSGDMEAIEELARMYSMGGRNLMVNRKKSIFYYEKLCNGGDGSSLSCIGLVSEYSNDGQEKKSDKLLRILCNEKKDGSACSLIKELEF